MVKVCKQMVRFNVVLVFCLQCFEFMYVQIHTKLGDLLHMYLTTPICMYVTILCDCIQK